MHRIAMGVGVERRSLTCFWKGLEPTETHSSFKDASALQSKHASFFLPSAEWRAMQISNEEITPRTQQRHMGSRPDKLSLVLVRFSRFLQVGRLLTAATPAMSILSISPPKLNPCCLGTTLHKASDLCGDAQCLGQC